MTAPSGFNTALAGVIGPNDAPISDAERRAAVAERLESRIVDLRADRVHAGSVLGLSGDGLVLAAADDLRILIRLSELPKSVRSSLDALILSSNIESIRKSLDATRAASRPSKTLYEFWAANAYFHLVVVEEQDHETGLVAAYEAYNPEWNYEKDSTTERDVPRRHSPSTVAAVRISRYILPMLRRYKLVTLKSKMGRPPKTTTKKPPAL